MSPQQQRDPVLAQLATLQTKVDGLRREVKTIAVTQDQHARKIQWMSAVALLAVGAIGGPDAVAALTGAA
ncbi:hypothetical protein ACFCXC_35340 [Streptomyces microflavus]|uniref:hypothetical protein n=1 Tax=Bacillati TaxID=1783272 RepID=UPI0035DCD4F6